MKYVKSLNRLFEGFSNFVYRMPKGFTDKLVDLYILSYFKKVDTLSNVDDKVLDIGLQDARGKLFNYLKEFLIKKLYPMVLGELMHIRDNIHYTALGEERYGLLYFNYKELYPSNDYSYGTANTKYLEALVSALNNEFGSHFELNNDNNIELSSLQGITKFNLIFLQKARNLFHSGSWMESYGGNNWFQLCNFLEKLYLAKDLNRIMIYVDLIVDLEHNTGLFMGKFLNTVELYDFNAFLNIKFSSVVGLDSLLTLCKSNLKGFATHLMKVVYNKSMDMRDTIKIGNNFYTKKFLEAGNFDTTFYIQDYNEVIAKGYKVNSVKRLFLKGGYKESLDINITNIEELRVMGSFKKLRFNGLKKCESIKVTSPTNDLENNILELNDLKKVDDIYLYNVAGVVKINSITVAGHIVIRGMDLDLIKFPKLKRCTRLTFQHCDFIRSINFKNLINCGSIIIENCDISEKILDFFRSKTKSLTLTDSTKI